MLPTIIRLYPVKNDPRASICYYVNVTNTRVIGLFQFPIENLLVMSGVTLMYSQ